MCAFKLQNAGLAPSNWPLGQRHAQWLEADILGGGQPGRAAMPGTNESVSLQLRVDVPKDAKPGSQNRHCAGEGRGSPAIDLPLTLTIASETRGQAHDPRPSCRR